MVNLLTVWLIPLAHAQPSELPVPASCADIFVTGGFLSAPGTGFYCAADYLAKMTYTTIGFAASIALVMLMINGFRYMVGPAIPGGSSDAAKKGISAALTGLVVALLTYIILDTLIYSVTL